MGMTGEVEPALGTTRQQARGQAAAAKRFAGRANRFGMGTGGKLVEPTRANTPPPAWPQIVMVGDAQKITGMVGRYTGKFMTFTVNATAGGALNVDNFCSAHGACEIWHPPDISVGEHHLLQADVLFAVMGPVHASRNKIIVVTIGGTGGQQIPQPNGPYQVLGSVPKTGGGFQWVPDYPRIWSGSGS